MRPIIATLIFSLALITKVAYQAIFDVSDKGMPTRIPLKEFPWGIVGEGWSEKRVELEERVEKIAGITEYLNWVFKKHRESSIWFYVGYYDGSSLESMHQPEICFPGAGWEIQNKRIESFSIPGVDNASFNLIEFKRNTQLKLTAFTFFYEGKFQPDQIYVEKGRVFGDRHFTIITTATNVYDSVDNARDNIEELVGQIIPKLLEHLPPSESK